MLRIFLRAFVLVGFKIPIIEVKRGFLGDGGGGASLLMSLILYIPSHLTSQHHIRFGHFPITFETVLGGRI